jgi:hypothetical protein
LLCTGLILKVKTSETKIVPKLPKSINDLEDLPDDYKLTITKQRFLAGPKNWVNYLRVNGGVMGDSKLRQNFTINII